MCSIYTEIKFWHLILWDLTSSTSCFANDSLVSSSKSMIILLSSAVIPLAIYFIGSFWHNFTIYTPFTCSIGDKPWDRSTRWYHSDFPDRAPHRPANQGKIPCPTGPPTAETRQYGGGHQFHEGRGNTTRLSKWAVNNIILTIKYSADSAMLLFWKPWISVLIRICLHFRWGEGSFCVLL